MKRFFLSLVALAAAIMSYAQSSVLATLSHDGEISTYYGAGALKSAHEAAEHGDVITLSSGSFQATNITKAVTIRGAGMCFDTLSNSDPTMIIGDFEIAIPNTVSSRLTLEGIYHNHKITIGELDNATFLKSRFGEIYCGNSDIFTNLTMIHCKVANSVKTIQNCNTSFLNCVVNEPYCGSKSAKYDFFNCMLMKESWGNNIDNCTFRNSIIYMATERGGLPSNIFKPSNNILNCVAYGITTDRWIVFRELSNSTNKVVENFEMLFRSFRGTYLDNETFELTDSAMTTFLGLDGTQVGIYGGSMPFDSTVSGPQIIRCNVANKSTADGKLSVDIEIKVKQ